MGSNMKIKEAKDGIRFEPESAIEEASLQAAYNQGHLHFSCKALLAVGKGAKFKSLYLVTSIQDWAVPGSEWIESKEKLPPTPPLNTRSDEEYLVACVSNYGGEDWRWEILKAWRETDREGVTTWRGDNQGQDGCDDEVFPVMWTPMPQPKVPAGAFQPERDK